MAGPWDKFQAPPANDGPWSKFGAPVAGPKKFDIDWSRPVEDVRAEVAKLPEADRKDALDQWAEAYVAKERSGPTSFENNPVTEGLRHLGRGTLIGTFADEAMGKVGDVAYNLTGGKVGAPEEEVLAYNRARNRAEDEAHPYLGTAGKLVGGVLTGAPIASKVIGGAKSTVGKIAASGGVGATAAATYGFGEGEGGLENRLESAKAAAPYGLAFGVGLPVAGKLIGGAAQKAADYLPAVKARLPISKVSNPEKVADEWLASKLRRSGQSPETVADDFAQGEHASRLYSNSKLGKKGVNEDNALIPETLADTSNAMQRLAGSVYRTGNEAGEIVKTRLDKRQRGPDNPYAPRTDIRPQGQLERLLDSLDRALLLRTSGSARSTEREIVKAQKATSDKLYEEARNASEAFDLAPALQGMTEKIQKYPPPFASKLIDAMNMFSRPVKVKGKTLSRPIDNVELFDNAKKALDDLIDDSTLHGKATNLTRELRQFKDDLLAKVHEGGKNATYKEARENWGSHTEMKKAIDLGRSSFKEDSEVSVEQFRELTEAQKKLFRIGLRESVRKAMGPARAGHDMTKIFDTRRAQELLAEAIPRSKADDAVFADRPQRFGEIVRREQRMGETNKTVLGGSPTQPRKMDDAEFASDALGSILTGGRTVLNYALEAVGAGLQKTFGYRRDVAVALAKRLVEADPVARAEILRKISAKMGPSRFSQFARRLGNVTTVRAAATGGAMGGNEPAPTR